MTQEEKELLSKDLCARLPYGVKIGTEYFTKATLVEIRKNISYGACKDLLVTYDISGEETPYQSEERSSTISKIKPYLFPLSSMSEEERMAIGNEFAYGQPQKAMDILHKRHIDFNGLIPKGLALDATGLNIY